MTSDAANLVHTDASEAGLYVATDCRERRRAEAWLTQRISQAALSSRPHSEVGTLTPALAELLLARNPDNRALKDYKVREFAQDIRDGNWEENGEPLIVSVDGFLNDGQHRCKAVIDSGRPIRTVFVFGVTRGSRLTVDQGTARTPGDYLHMDGVADSKTAAAVATLLWIYDNHGKLPKDHSIWPTKAQIREWYFLNPKISASIRAIPSRGYAVIGSKTVLAFCHCIFARRDHAASDQFIRQLVNGEGLIKGDPIYACRERLIRDKRLRKYEKIEIIFRAWNAFRTGRPIDKFPVNGNLPTLED